MRLCFLLLCAVPAFPAMLVTVTSGLGNYGNGGPDCTRQSTGPQITCSTSYQGQTGFAVATASAFSGPGDVGVNTGVGGFGFAQARAQAEDSRRLIVDRNMTIVGIYYVFAERELYGFPAQVRIQQGATVRTDAGGPNTYTMESNVLAGIPFTLDLFVSAYVGTPGGDSQAGEIRFVGLTDLAGNPVPFVVVQNPEPATWMLLACGLAALMLVTKQSWAE